MALERPEALAHVAASVVGERRTWALGAFASFATVMAVAAQPLPAQTFTVGSEPGFKPVAAALQAYVEAQPTPPAARSRQQFCVVGYGQGDKRHAWVYWHQGQRLVYWEPAGEDIESKETLTRSRRDLNLRRDVVATPAELGGSTYRVDRPWLNALLADCRRRGERHTLGPR